MEDLTLTMEEVSIVEVMEDLTQVITMDSGTEVSMMVRTTTQDLTLGTTTMDSGMADSMVVALTEGRMGASIPETIITTMDSGTVKKVKDIILDIGMAKKAMDTIRRMEGPTWVSSLVFLSGWLV